MEINPKGIMNIGLRGPTSLRRAKNADKAGFSSEISEDSAAVSIETSSPLQSPHALAGVDALFFAVESHKSPEEQEVMRAESLLNRLDNIRVGILLGEIPQNVLLELSDLSSKPIAQIDNPQLQEIIQEIETRAKVELAKLDRLKVSPQPL
jgi:Class II flagellar assembly regulator